MYGLNLFDFIHFGQCMVLSVDFLAMYGSKYWMLYIWENIVSDFIGTAWLKYWILYVLGAVSLEVLFCLHFMIRSIGFYKFWPMYFSIILALYG